MNCRHCKKSIRFVAHHPNAHERDVWGDGKYVVCDIADHWQFHEPDIPVEDMIADLQAIVNDL